MSNKLEIGVIITLIASISSGALLLGNMQGRISSLEDIIHSPDEKVKELRDNLNKIEIEIKKLQLLTKKMKPEVDFPKQEAKEPEINSKNNLLFNPPLRSKPNNNLSEEDVGLSIKQKKLFNAELNNEIKGIENIFNVDSTKRTVKDQTTGLRWEQSGSVGEITYEEAKQRIITLNKMPFAGYNDWRLPTLEEAMSLVEPTEKNGYLYIDEKFNRNQRRIWTADKLRENRVWYVDFTEANCGIYSPTRSLYMRAVRSE